VLAEHQWIIAQYPEAAQIDVWGDDPRRVVDGDTGSGEARAGRLAAKRGLHVL
jgi:hypothetical protein